MTLRKKIKWIFIFSVVFLAAYLFAAAIPLSNDFYFQPEWTKSIASAASLEENAISINASKAHAFMLGDNFGFFTSGGEIFKGETGDMRFSAGGSSWCVYPEGARRTEIRAPDGSLKATIEEAGFVHLTENGIYLFHPGGGAVSRYAEDGSLIWTRDETAPITAFSDSAGGTVIGYGSGLLMAVDTKGENLFSFYPGGSDYQVILGAAISNDGRLAACVSGISPQRIVLVETGNGQHRIIAHRNFDSALYRQVFTSFCGSGKRAFFETPSGLGILDTQTRTFSEIQIEGQILNVVEYLGTDFFAALVRTGPGRHLLALMETPDIEAASVDFECRDAFLLFSDGGLYLGSDENISKISIRSSKEEQR